MSIQPSDINTAGTGFDPIGNGSIDVSGDINAGSSGNTDNSWFSGLIGGLASLFDNGVKIYNSVSGQAAANALIKAQTDAVKTKTALLTTPSTSSSLLSKDNLIKIGIVLAVGIGALYLVKKVKVA